MMRYDSSSWLPAFFFALISLHLRLYSNSFRRIAVMRKSPFVIACVFGLDLAGVPWVPAASCSGPSDLS